MRKKFSVCLLVAMCSLSVTPAMADLSINSEPIPGGSWTLPNYWLWGIGAFDLLAIRMMPGTDTSSADVAPSGFDSLKHLAMSDFRTGTWTLDPDTLPPAPGWSTVYENDPTYPTLVTATGSPVEFLWWDTKFAGVSTENSLSLQLAAMLGDTVLYSAQADWNGSVLLVNESVHWNPTRSELLPSTEPVPVPGAALLGLLGLGYAGMRLRKGA